MANKGKKVRHVKNIGSVYYDSTTEQWVGQVENGRYSNGRVKFKRFYSNSQDEVIYKMKEFKEKESVLTKTATPNDKEQMLVSDFFESFIETIKKPKLKPSSYTRNLCSWNNNIKPYIGGYYLHELTTQTIQNEMVNKMLLSGLSYSTIHKATILTNEGLKFAYRQGMIPSNPCEFIELPKKSDSVPKEIRFF